MSEDDIRECHSLGRQIADYESKLAAWKQRLHVDEVMVVGLTDKVGSLLIRQRNLYEGKWPEGAKAASGS